MTVTTETHIHKVYPPLNVPGGVQMAVKLNHAGQPAVCVMGLKYTGSGSWGLVSASTLSTILQRWTTVFRNCFLGDVTVTGADFRETVDGGQVVTVGAPATTPSGNISGTSLAGYSGLIKWNTGFGGRSGKGRTFLPGISGGQLSNQGRAYDSAYATLLNTAAASWVANTGDADHVPAVLSRADQVARVITSGAASSIPGIQRRRMRA